MCPVTITQFGGHTSSYAGDCAVVAIDTPGDREAIVIDTGSSRVWSGPTELPGHVRASLSQAARFTVTVITTHFHEDHFNPKNIHRLKVDRHVFPEEAARNCGEVIPIGTQVAQAAGVHELRSPESGCLVRLYVPSGGAPDDQNDQSMAVYLESGELSFLSFGDMTRDAYDRLVSQVGDLPRARVTKYPHHGNHPSNYLGYYEEDLSGSEVLISGNSGCEVQRTISSLLEHGARAVYGLARTDDARELFRLSWRDPGQPVFLCTDAVVSEAGVFPVNGLKLERVEERLSSRRSVTHERWVPLEEEPGEVKMDL